MKSSRFSLSLIVFSSVAVMASPPPGKATFATVTGSVRDNKGNPVVGALIHLYEKEREGHSRNEKRPPMAVSLQLSPWPVWNQGHRCRVQ